MDSTSPGASAVDNARGVGTSCGPVGVNTYVSRAATADRPDLVIGEPKAASER
ncbi:hypothetical protein [Micromonospora robiginosa]|uniref:Uncharacterized protein n=1 Tax=Micromonospora robiginosa TaxID=2749844 RepID=A0A7L6AZA0_9ACTN|nr:hypothetical protein [Micromonospora ferruginea]QLQ34906.1 hypothetical protein H1D33_26220 [Micromonospora ferruginea]